MSAAAWTISIIAIGVALSLALRWALDGRRRTHRSIDERPAFEFMSPAWIAIARREIVRAVSSADLDVEPFTLSEEYTDAPTHLRRGTERIGFTVRIGDGRIEVSDRPDPVADCRVISDYAEALAIARDPAAASTDAAEASRGIARGRLRIEGDPSRMPAALQRLDVHTLLASHTA